jgi:type IX secretion system PorP/SprF family membrane protein
MKNIFSTIILCFFVFVAFGQQDPQNTQFMQYKLGYNPGYAGAKESACIACLHRAQWLGLDGAPEFTVMSFNMPLFNQKVGIGANLERYKVGLFESYTFDAVYSYRVRVGQGSLGLGLQGSVRSLEGNFQMATATEDRFADQSIPLGQESKVLANVGAGLYYSSPKFYAGISVPRFLKNNVDFADENNVISREVNHFYFMGGVTFNLSDKVKLQPQTLVRYVSNAPVDADINANLIINNRYIFGATYRLGGNKENSTGESFDILVAAQLTDNLLFAMSYDITISDLRDYNSGSIEASLHYCFGKSQGEEYTNPRFF